MSQNIHAIEFNIDLALRNITKSRFLWTDYGGAPPDDPSIDRERAEVARELERLNIALTSLKAHAHRDELEFRHSRRLPRDRQYLIVQGARSRAANLKRIYDKAKEVEKRLRRAERSSYSMHPLDALAQLSAGPVERNIQDALTKVPNGYDSERSYDIKGIDGYIDGVALVLASIVALGNLLIQKKRR